MLTLRGDEGYYSREVEFDGTTIKIRELTDEELDQFLQADAAGREALREAVVAKGANDAAIRKRLKAIPPDNPLALGLLANELLEPEEQVTVLRRLRETVDIVCRAGVVSWNITTGDCTPDNAVRLPNHIKVQLAKDIIADTVMTDREAGNSLTPPRAS